MRTDRGGCDSPFPNKPLSTYWLLLVLSLSLSLSSPLLPCEKLKLPTFRAPAGHIGHRLPLAVMGVQVLLAYGVHIVKPLPVAQTHQQGWNAPATGV